MCTIPCGLVTVRLKACQEDTSLKQSVFSCARLGYACKVSCIKKGHKVFDSSQGKKKKKKTGAGEGGGVHTT